jgi:hypothetical protein
MGWAGIPYHCHLLINLRGALMYEKLLTATGVLTAWQCELARVTHQYGEGELSDREMENLVFTLQHEYTLAYTKALAED